MIKRQIFSSLEKHLNKKEITILTGPRQVGKTFLMEILFKRSREREEKTLFLSLDFDEDRQFFISQSALLKKIHLEIGKSKGFVFIDEIQRRENAGLFLKGIFDMNLPYKFIVSGSGSMELKEKIHESLAGRKQIFEINPITFIEFVNFKTDYRYEEKLNEFINLEKGKILEFLEEYMTFGGYPKVILGETISDKQNIMKEIYQSYMEKDIKSLLNLDKTESFTNLVKILASQIGGLINITELSSTIGIADKTVKNYLWYLEKTFITNKITPYFRNIRKEITKAPVYYFYDTGLRNYILGLFGVFSSTVSNGHLFENFVFNHIREGIHFASSKIHFWRTRDGAEVDFVIETGVNLIPVEVKYTKLIKPQISRSYRSFLAKYSPKNAYIIHLGGRMETIIGKTRVKFIPFYEINFLNLHSF